MMVYHHKLLFGPPSLDKTHELRRDDILMGDGYKWHGTHSKLTNAHKLVRFKGITCHETQKGHTMFTIQW